MQKLFRVFIALIATASAFTGTAQAPLKPRDSNAGNPQTFAMIMGISKYKYVRPLAYADKDAEMFRDYLKSPAGGNVRPDNIFCLLNEQALSSNFWGKGFQWLKAKNLQKGDRLFIYLAGHGDAIDEDQFFFLSYDCNPAGDKNNYLVSGAIQLFNLKKKIAAETSKGVEVFFIMDACRSNELPGGLPGQNFLNAAITEKRAGEMIMLATGAGQESLEDASIGTGQGLFTYYLVDGLSGVADSIDTDNRISFREIQSYVTRNVPSVAQQRFKRKQDPYFCCNENSDKIISIVDTAYLQKWLRTKRQQSRGGNAYHGDRGFPVSQLSADTTLQQSYDLFYKAIRNNNLTGSASAEYYYQQMNRGYAGNPYTLDAKSTLAVEFVNVAQNRINQYLSCQDDISTAEKQKNFEAGVRLEQAINMIREDDPDFANTLRSRAYFLKASGDFGTSGRNGTVSDALQYAHSARAIDPNGAYINNRLAILHLANNRSDSAMYYASKATRDAPNWLCALTTLSLAQKSVSRLPTDSTRKPKNNISKRPQFGLVLGGGMSQLNVKKSEWRQGNINYNDSLRAITPNGTIKLDIGFTTLFPVTERVSIRPSVIVSFQESDLSYERRSVTGGFFVDEVKIKTTTIDVPVPVTIRLTSRNVAPFFSIGPTFSFLVKQDDQNKARLPLKSFDLMGDAGIGVDIPIAKNRMRLSPELRYTRGITNSVENANNIYTNTIDKLNKQAFTFSLYLRGLPK